MELTAASSLAFDLMKQHGLIDQGWILQFDRAVRRLGFCRHSTRTISLGAHATQVNTEEAVRNTVLHEIAHALVGPRNGHNSVWRAKAQEIGCNGHRTSAIAQAAPHTWEVKCVPCNKRWAFYRQPKRYIGRTHARCGNVVSVCRAETKSTPEVI